MMRSSARFSPHPRLLRVLLALAVQELAANLPRIENLVLTPDLLAPVLTRLGLGKDAA